MLEHLKWVRDMGQTRAGREALYGTLGPYLEGGEGHTEQTARLAEELRGAGGRDG